jgi:DNA-binding GntR family transcriptional regulator
VSQLPQLSSSTLGDQAYAAIREAIVGGTLSRGEKVTERGLAQSLNISPTPVREALRRLEQDGLVERSGPRSVRVAEYAEDQLREITLIEDSLRALAARLAAEKATDAQLAEMRTTLDRAEMLCGQLLTNGHDATPDPERVGKIFDAVRHFHEVVDQASANSTLIHMLKMVDAFDSGERRRATLLELEVDPPAVQARYEEHRAIFDAIADRDPDQAERLMRQHSESGSTARLSIRRRA